MVLTKRNIVLHWQHVAYRPGIRRNAFSDNEAFKTHVVPEPVLLNGIVRSLSESHVSKVPGGILDSGVTLVAMEKAHAYGIASCCGSHLSHVCVCDPRAVPLSRTTRGGRWVGYNMDIRFSHSVI